MNTKLSKLGIGATIILLLVSACGIAPTFGSGDLVTKTYQVSGFDGVSVSGGGDLVIIQDGTESVSVETDDNLMQYVVTEVRNGTLDLYLDNQGLRNFRPTKLIFTVHVKNLTAVTTSGSWDLTSEKIDTDDLSIVVSGSGNVTISDLTAENLSVMISGSGEMDAAGEVTDQDITVSGSGKIRLGDLLSETALINISGSGEATLWVTTSLTAEISGSGTVLYYGNPQTTINTSGSGDIQHLGDK